jgi:hypothetical protein
MTHLNAVHPFRAEAFQAPEMRGDCGVSDYRARRLSEAVSVPGRGRGPDHLSCAGRCLFYHRTCDPCGLRK